MRESDDLSQKITGFSSDTTPLPAGKLPGQLLGPLVQRFGSQHPDVVVGPGLGRDAAVIRGSHELLVVKTDPITFATDHIGSYLVHVNANDLACLGATPRWLLVTALLPPGSTTPASVTTMFTELHDTCAALGIDLIGGHCEITIGLDRPIMVGAMLGEVSEHNLIRPGEARPGDRLLLTKALAIEGTSVLAREMSSPLTAALGKEIVEEAKALLTTPGISIVDDAQVLRRAGGITALHDVTEGGLATGARELAEASGLGLELRTTIPVLASTAAVAERMGIDPLGMLASGSLLAAAAPAAVPDLVAAGENAGILVTEVGTLLPSGAGYWLADEDERQPLPSFAVDELTRVLSEVYTHVGEVPNPAEQEST